MQYGYNGRILKVNLTNGSILVEEQGEDFYRQYLGGTGLVSYYLMKEQAPKVDPYSPENKLVFATGVMTGAPIGGSGRNVIGTKSPLSNAFNTSEAGGYWGAELKFAGFDAVVVEGKANKPVYIWIQDGKIEIRDAADLWGRSVGNTQELIRQELADPGIRTALIGPGGEKLVRYACVAIDVGHFTGRGGTGAVMGSKNLKGIAVRGHNRPPLFDPKAINEIAKWFRGRVEAEPILSVFHNVGTIDGPIPYSDSGGLPVRNFQAGSFSGVEKLAPEIYMDTLGAERNSCYACPIRCKHKVKIKNSYGLTFEHYHGHGPEFESMVGFGPFCGIDDLQAITCANELCTAYSVDTISCGSTIAFAMECFEKGLLSELDTGGLKLTFGDARAMVKAVEMICKREGFGNILAEGSLRVARGIGKGAEQYAMQSRGVEFAMQNPYFKPILGLGYAVCPTGGDHMRNLVFSHVIDAERAKAGSHSEARDNLLRQYHSLGLLSPVYQRQIDNPTTVRELIYVSTLMTVIDSLGMCIFATLGYQYHQLVELLNKVTGWDSNLWELMKSGERIMNMMRAFNNLEGFTREDDRIPERFFQPMQSGPLKGTKLDKEEFEKGKELYYGMMYWDKQGNPTRSKLQELDIEWVADKLYLKN